MQQQIEQFNFEQAAQIIKTLTLEDLDKLQQVIEAEKQSKRENAEKDEKLRIHLEKYKKAKEWLAVNSENYLNEWVCLEGDKLIAHGTDALEVHNKAKAAGIKSPFLHHILKEEEFFWAGWL